MTDETRREDEQLDRLLASVRADAEPALWTRVRARIEAAERRPRWLAWSMRPAALAAALSLLVVSVVASVALVVTTPRVTTVVASDDLGDALVAELDQSSASEVGVGPALPTRSAPAAYDSGATR